MKDVPVIDGHIDLAWNYTALGRRFEQSVSVKHKLDSEEIIKAEGLAAVGLPEVKAGNIRIIFGTIWVETAQSLFPTLGPKYQDASSAKRLALNQLQYYNSLSKYGVEFIQSLTQAESIVFSDSYRFGIVPIIEGADFIQNTDDLDFWINSGVRIIAPVWQKNQYAGCSEIGGGLTKEGRSLVRYIDAKGLAIDISHMSDAGAENTFSETSGMIINSHTCCRHFSNDERYINDYQIRNIHQRNGVIGLMTWASKLKKRTSAAIADYVDHISYVCDVVGSIDNVAIGSSMDGGYGVEQLPIGMKHIGSLELIADEMIKRGFSSENIHDFLYNNWLRVLQRTLPEKK